jgi:glucose/arabinose dehydrogenase
VRRGRLVGGGLGLALLGLLMGCSLAGSGPALPGGADLLAVTPPLPLTAPAPFAPLPYASSAPLPTEIVPTPHLTSTPLPTVTPTISLDNLRKTPTPETTVMGHGLALPPGFKVNVYAQGLASVAYMTYGAQDVLYASLPDKGAVVAMRHNAEKGEARDLKVFAQGLTTPTGLAFSNGYLYVAEAQRVVRYACSAAQLEASGPPQVVVPNLPAGSGLNNHPIGFGPDGKLYVGIGATCNACRETDYRRATIMRYEPDGTQEEIYAQGLRDVEGLTWYPNTGQMLASNCNRLRMGPDIPPDTLEYVYHGANFGWPFCHAGEFPDPELGWPAACEGIPRPFQSFQAQASPRGLCVYTGDQFPADYYGDIFVALYGSWERWIPVGYKIVRLDIENGVVVGQEDFCSGWLYMMQAWGRPAAVLQGVDGSLLVADDKAGAIYRISYQP